MEEEFDRAVALRRELTEDEAEDLVLEAGQIFNLDSFGDEHFPQYLGISKGQFDLLVSRCEDALWHNGRGRGSKLTPRQRMFMVLMEARTGFRHGDLGHRLGVGQSVVSRLDAQTVMRIQPVMEEMIAEEKATRHDMQFEDFPDAVAAVDVTELEIQKPKDEPREFFSGKKGHHHVKLLVAVGRNGLCWYAYIQLPECNGRHHDMNVFRASGFVHELEFTVRSRHGLVTNYYPVLMDSGFQGAQHLIGDAAIFPTRKPRGGDQMDDQEETNQMIQKGRGIVERFFGRMKMKFALMHGTFRRHRNELPAWALLCVVLTNLDIRDGHPLNANDPAIGGGDEASED
jgi:hypothetical protein